MASDTDLARQQEHVDLLRRRIINVVGHELKVPVSTIRGLAESLTRASADEVRDEIAPALVRNTARLERLVDDLLLASGVFTVRPVEEPRPQPVGEAITRAWASVGANGDMALLGDADATVLSRADSVERVLAALLDNARKYGEPPIAVRVSRKPRSVVIEVMSSGVPAPTDLELALEPFFRGEGAVTAAPGLGLGLAVASALAGQDGGRVDIRAQDGRVVARAELAAP